MGLKNQEKNINRNKTLQLTKNCGKNQMNFH